VASADGVGDGDVARPALILLLVRNFLWTQYECTAVDLAYESEVFYKQSLAKLEKINNTIGALGFGGSLLRKLLGITLSGRGQRADRFGSRIAHTY
jgi:hypothetical protein